MHFPAPRSRFTRVGTPSEALSIATTSYCSVSHSHAILQASSFKTHATLVPELALPCCIILYVDINLVTDTFIAGLDALIYKESLSWTGHHGHALFSLQKPEVEYSVRNPGSSCALHGMTILLDPPPQPDILETIFCRSTKRTMISPSCPCHFDAGERVRRSRSRLMGT